MLEYSVIDGYKTVPCAQVEFMKKMFDADKHENFAQAIGFDILQDLAVIDESSPHDAQNYSVVVKTKSTVQHDLGHGYTGYYALIEVHGEGDETIIFVETPLDCFDLFSTLIEKQKIINANLKL